MRILCAAVLLLLSLVPALADPAAQWWADVSALADDSMKGRLTGSADYLRAADYVIGRLEAEGLKPAGVNGFLQPVDFEQQLVRPGQQPPPNWRAPAAGLSKSATTC